MRRLLLVCLVLFAPCLAGQEEVPDPADGLGFEPGEDSKLADWKTLTAYFQALAAASPRVEVESIGPTTLGRDMILVVLSSPENLARRAEIQADSRRLATDPDLAGEDLERIVEEGRLVVLVSCNIHSDEIASSLMAPKFVHWLATSDSPEVVALLDDLVVLVVPSMNPDGLDLVVDWYRKTLGTPHEGSSMPWLYHYYAGHDDNRDWYMLNLVETRNVTRVLYEEWFPRILVDVHQMGQRGARFFVPPYADPLNPNVDPLLVAEIDFVGSKMALDLSSAGLQGVVQGEIFDNYWDGGVRNVPYRHNVIGILTEAASARIASPIFLRGSDLQAPRGRSGLEPRGNHPDPWPGGWWRIGDIVRYEMEALRSVLFLAAGHRRQFLANGHRLVRRAVAAGRREPPFAFVVPADQDDPPTARRLLEILEGGGVEIHRATIEFEADDVVHPAGSWVVLMNQPYRAHAKDLLEVQEYPAARTPGGEALRPYDAAGWTLPLAMGVDVHEVRHPFEADLEPLEGVSIGPPIVPEPPEGGAWILPCRVNASFRVVNRLLAAGVAVGRVVTAPAGAAGDIRPGDFTVRALGEAGLAEALERAPIPIGVVGRLEDLGVEWLDPVRLGVYQPWTASIDEGWTRFVLDEFRFRYRSVRNARIRAGALRGEFDVLVVPDIDASTILDGRPASEAPARYAGGIGKRGLAHLHRFVEEGGRVVLLGRSSALALDRSAGRVTDALARAEDFACPGSILRAIVTPEHPLTYGYGREAAVTFADSPAFDVSDLPGALIFPERDLLLSGWIQGEQALAGRSALVEIPDGDGRWVLFGFRPQHRGQTHGTYRFLFNAIYRVEPPAPPGDGEEE